MSMSPSPANCHVFQDGEDWLVFAPASGLLLRTNRSKAAEFERCASQTEGPSASLMSREKDFGWSDVDTILISCGNRCRLRCRYCLSNDDGPDIAPDPEFCRLALREILSGSNEEGRIKVGFLGIGEPTIPWNHFADCVSAVEEVATELVRPVEMGLTTDGQMEGAERSWLCAKMQSIEVSLDGPPAVQNRQRPRKDGRDSYHHPAALITEGLARGKGVIIRTTITGETVGQMAEFVNFFADAFGKRIKVVFTAMMDLEGAPGGFAPPEPDIFIKNLGTALDHATARHVQVGHCVVSLEALILDATREANRTVCLLPNRTVARHSEPFWLDDARKFSSSVFARYEPRLGRLTVDGRRHRESFNGVLPSRCRTCACAAACAGHPSSWGWDEAHPGDDECEVRRGVMLEILRRAV